MTFGSSFDHRHSFLRIDTAHSSSVLRCLHDPVAADQIGHFLALVTNKLVVWFERKRDAWIESQHHLVTTSRRRTSRPHFIIKPLPLLLALGPFVLSIPRARPVWPRRVVIAAGNRCYSTMVSSLRILHPPSAAANASQHPVIILVLDAKKYVFNAPEGTVRTITQRKAGVGGKGQSHVFVCDACEGVRGLPGESEIVHRSGKMTRRRS